MADINSASAPIVFQFASTNQIRVIVIDSEPWFVAADVCAALGLTNPSMAIAGLDDDERTRLDLSDPKLNLGSAPGKGAQSLTIISEPGLYTLILRCRDAVKPGTVAHRFRKWVTGEVLPAIRKTGRYSQPRLQPYPIDPSPHLINGFHIAQLLEDLKFTASKFKHTPNAKARVERRLLEDFEIKHLHELPLSDFENVRNWLHAMRINIVGHNCGLQILEERFIAQTDLFNEGARALEHHHEAS